MVAPFLPALPALTSFPQGSQHTVVVDTVFQALVGLNVVQEQGCEKLLVSDLHMVDTFLWLQHDVTLWSIPQSKLELERKTDCCLMSAIDFISLQDCVVKVGEGPLARDEGKCIVTLFHGLDQLAVGYYQDAWYDGWAAVPLSDFVNCFASLF